MIWIVKFHPRADRELDALDPVARRRVLRAIRNLAQDPSAASNAMPMTGSNEYRLRVGDWRVVYTLHEDLLMVLVVRVAHRREVYR